MVGRYFAMYIHNQTFSGEPEALLVNRIAFRKDNYMQRKKKSTNKLERTQHFPMYQSWYFDILQRVMVTV